jgi:hypothetical protein
MAPAHSFDLRTLEALRRGTDIRWITDGIAARPFSRPSFGWLPVQMARLHDYLPFGYLTECIHPNTMSSRDFERLINDLRRTRSQIVTMEAIPTPRPYGFVDWAFEKLYWSARALRDARRAVPYIAAESLILETGGGVRPRRKCDQMKLAHAVAAVHRCPHFTQARQVFRRNARNNLHEFLDAPYRSAAYARTVSAGSDVLS